MDRKQEEEKRIAEIAVRNANENLRKTLLQLLCGGIAGATARSFVAPIDRVKILMQTQQLILEKQVTILKLQELMVKH